MTIEQLIELTENRLRHHQSMVKIFTEQGDAQNVLHHQKLADETEVTLLKLKQL